ncbi:four helix bundle protein [Bacteroidota bacterium]
MKKMNDMIERNKNINRGYRKLEVWKLAIDLFVMVRNEIKMISNLSLKVKSQIEDSALSVSSNIAEGYCRRSIKENIQFNNIALASLGENYTQIFALHKSNDIPENWFIDYDNLHYELENKLIAMNKSIVNKLKNNDEWKNDYIIKEIIEAYEV